MWFILAALRRPYTVLVALVAIAVAAYLAIRRAPADIFPSLSVPVIYVVQPYAGMSPTQMEGQLVNYYEYHFLYVAGIEHVESQSIQGMGVIKLYFHPGTDIAQAMSQVNAMAFRSISFMPPGTLPPFMVRFDAGSIPVGQLVFSSDTRNEAEVQDLALNSVRPLLATLPGVSAPPPSGGKVRTIVGYLDPERMRAHGLSADEVATAIARANTVLPAGNVRIGDQTAIAETDALVAAPRDLERVPLRVTPQGSVFFRDIGRIEDDADIVYNVALVDGRPTVYMPVTKRADASTLDVVANVKEALPRMRALLPDDVALSLEFDQSVWVTQAILGLVEEGALGAVLTALMVLIFLRDLRSALIVVLTIPTSVLAAVVALRLTGQTINIMTLSGLALAVGILVDEATVAIENIHAHLARGGETRRAVVAAMVEVMTPRLLAMLCVLAVFIPAFAMAGIGASLFPPLALAVGFAMAASFAISTTLVPVLAAWWLRPHAPRERPSRVVAAYRALIGLVVRGRWLVLAMYVLALAPALQLAGRLGTELFPQVDTGEMALRIRATPGTRLERTVEVVREVDRIVRDEVGPGAVRMSLANIGNPAWTFPVNAVYVFNAGPHEATLLIALRDGSGIAVADLQERLRARFVAELPDVRVSFEAGDVVSRITSFGAAAAIEVSVSGKSLPAVRRHAEQIVEVLRGLPVLRDVQIPQALDAPSIRVAVDRERAGRHGLTAQSIGRSLVSATSSTVLTTPLFWTDPNTGNPYRVALRVPEAELRTVDDLAALPVGGGRETTLGQVADITVVDVPGQIDRRDNQRMVSVTANIAGRDLGSAAGAVRAALAKIETPRGVRVAVHGQVEQMDLAVASLGEGLVLTIAAVLLLLVAAFQSLRDPLVVLTSIPAVLAGATVALLVTGTTWNVQSLMGLVMAIGVSVANTVLLVSFARQARAAGATAAEAIVSAAAGRLRPIVMTSAAMIAGMVPMAAALGGGGEASAPLGRAVIGGLVASTIATLLVVPAAYTVFAARTHRSASLAPDDGDRS